MSVSEQSRTKVFISYSHKDEKWLNELRPQLNYLERRLSLDIWDDTKIRAGEKWKAKIEEALGFAKVAVLLVSKHFLASEFILSKELPALLTINKKEGTTLLAIILSPCAYDDYEELSEFQAVNSPTKTVVDMSEGEREALFVKTTKQIEAALGPKASQELEDRDDGLTAIQDPQKGIGHTTYNDRLRILLLEKRVEKYSALWQLTGLLPKWPKSNDVTYEKLKQLSIELRDWYFMQQGGMYLTREAHITYSRLQDALAELMERSGPIANDHYDHVRQECSRLRTELTEDLQTRRR